MTVPAPASENPPESRLTESRLTESRLDALYRRWSKMLPLLVLLLTLLLSTALAAVLRHYTLEQQRARFFRETTAHTTALQQRVLDYDNLLQSTRAFWQAYPGDVTPQTFEQFSRTLGLSSRYPDVLALGFDAWIPAGAESTLETLASSLGLPGYTIGPAQTTQAWRAPILLVAPQSLTNIKAQGFDMMSEPQRRAAMTRAIKTGTFQVTPPIPLVQRDPAGQPYSGFLMMLPVWNNTPGQLLSSQERATPGGAGLEMGQVRGFLYVAVRADLFLSSLETAYTQKGILSRTSLGGQSLLNQPALSGAFRQTTTLDMGGLKWQLDYAAPSHFGQDAFGVVPLLSFLAGALLAALTFRSMSFQVLARERVENINASLRESQTVQERSKAEFEAIFQSMQDAAAFTDATGQIRMVNRALNRQFGYRRGELSGRPLSSLHLDPQLEQYPTFQALTTPYQRHDGSQFFGEAQRSEVSDQSGVPLGLLEVVRDVTERVQSERAMQQQERRSRGVLDGIPHILWVSDPSGVVTYTNTQHRHRLGQRSVRERVMPEDLETYDQMWNDAYALRSASQSEVRLNIGKDGAAGTRPSWRWFEIRVAPLLGDEGQASEWVASATDIHDRLQAERLAQRNEERYRGVIEGMPQIVWLTDSRGQATYFNRRWLEYVGLERALDGLDTTIHPDDRPQYQHLWYEALTHKKNFEAEHRLLGADGRYRTFVTRGLPIQDAAGHVIEWVGTSTDVDASVYAENAARLLADVSTELTARATDPLADRWTQHSWMPHRWTKYRAALRLMTGWFMESAAIWTLPEFALLASSFGDPRWQLAHLQDAIVDIARRVAASEQTEEVQAHPLLHVVSAAGGIVTPLIGLDGTVHGVLALAYRHELLDRDRELIAELVQHLASALDNDALRDRAQVAQQELQNLNASLEERVQRRTTELEEANRELEAFSYSVSHDLRTPLRHVVGFGDLLRKESADTLSAKGTRYLSVMNDAAERMNILIDSLLEFSRMGRMPLRFVDVPLGPLVARAWEHLEPDRQGREVVFELGELPTVQGDATLLDLVFQNLLSNALKYSRTREVAHISVTARLRGAGDGQTGSQDVQILIQDNGVGFDPKYADKLFGVFQRLHRAEEFDGNGIGLANVRRIVSRHGGQVGAESVLGQGATFFITLPLVAPEQSLASQEAASLAQEGQV